MKTNSKKFTRNDAAFTGLEAAIVLIAFVVVAAVFSYVMLGAGFFTSQKSQQSVHTAVTQASSELQVVDTTILEGDTANSVADGAAVTIGLASGGTSIDLNKLTASYQTNTYLEDNIFSGHTCDATDANTIGTLSTTSDVNWSAANDGGYYYVVNSVDPITGTSTNHMLAKGDTVVLNLPFPDTTRHTLATGNAAFANDERPGVNEWFILDIKTDTGADVKLTYTVPATVTSFMKVY